jgi:cell division protease FtsH
MVSAPDVRGRLGILKVHTKKTPLEDNVDLEIIAKGTPGFTGADLANLVNEAALNAARFNKKKLTNEDFEQAKDKVLMGPERRSLVISDKEKLMTAYHEAGHTLVGMNLPYTDPIHKVSIMPRGGALGVTQTLPNEDMLSLTNDRAENFIAFLMGGRCAEEIVYGQMTSGASNDIERGTGLARSMVCKWGMSEKMGPISYHKSATSPFSGMGDNVDYSEKTAQEIDEEINRIVEKNYKQAINILKSNRDALDRLAQALVLWETIDLQQVKDVVAGNDIGLPLVRPQKIPTFNQTQAKAKEENNSETAPKEPVLA